MCAGQTNAGKVRGVRLFGSVSTALETTFNTLAAAGSIKCPAYEPPTANDTGKVKISAQDRMTQAVWIMDAAKSSLKAPAMALATCTYDGSGERRSEAVSVLAAHFERLHANAKLLRAVIEREIVFGNTYCPPLRQVAQEVGVSQTTVETVARRVQQAFAVLGVELERRLRAEFGRRGWV